jgi:hypothetical protein
MKIQSIWKCVFSSIVFIKKKVNLKIHLSNSLYIEFHGHSTKIWSSVTNVNVEEDKNRDNMTLTEYRQQQTQLWSLNGFLCIYDHAINWPKHHNSISTAHSACLLLPLLFRVSGIRNTWHLTQYILQFGQIPPITVPNCNIPYSS